MRPFLILATVLKLTLLLCSFASGQERDWSAVEVEIDLGNGGKAVGTAAVLDECRLLTCAHVATESKSGEVFLWLPDGKRRGKVVSIDSENDLAVIEVESKLSLPFRRIAKSPVSAGDVIWSVGRTVPRTIAAVQAKVLERKQVKYERSKGKTWVFETNEFPPQGRSGSPVVNEKGEIVGILSARDNNRRTATIIDLEHIRNLLNSDKPQVAEAASFRLLEVWKTTSCVPCEQAQRAWGTDQPGWKIEYKLERPSWVDQLTAKHPDAGFPIQSWTGKDGKTHVTYGYRAWSDQLKLLESDGGLVVEPQAVEGRARAQRVGRRSIKCREQVAQFLRVSSAALAYFGEEIIVDWETDHKELAIGKIKPIDLLGRSGRFSIRGTDKAVRYRVQDGEIYLDIEEFKATESHDPNKVGSISAFTILTICTTVYSLLNPEMTLIIPDKNSLTISMRADEFLAAIDGPEAKVKWSFFGFLRPETTAGIRDVRISEKQVVIDIDSRVYDKLVLDVE